MKDIRGGPLCRVGLDWLIKIEENEDFKCEMKVKDELLESWRKRRYMMMGGSEKFSDET